MAGPYQIPRNVKGEGRILNIFSTKGLIFTAGGAAIGLLFYVLFNSLKITILAWGFLVLFAGIGFIIGTLKMPNTNAFDLTRKTGGENLDDILLRYARFKLHGKKIYSIMKEEDTKDE